MTRHAVLDDLHGDFTALAAIVAAHSSWESVTLLGDLGIGMPVRRDPPA